MTKLIDASDFKALYKALHYHPETCGIIVWTAEDAIEMGIDPYSVSWDDVVDKGMSEGYELIEATGQPKE